MSDQACCKRFQHMTSPPPYAYAMAPPVAAAKKAEAAAAAAAASAALLADEGGSICPPASVPPAPALTGPGATAALSAPSSDMSAENDHAYKCIRQR